jgi:hypothetical protein
MKRESLSIVGLALVVCAAQSRAQTLLDLRSQTRNVDFSAAVMTRPVKTGTVLPATCAGGQLFFKTDAPAGTNLYGCVGTNTWVTQGGSVQQSVLGGLDFQLAGGMFTLSPGKVRLGSRVFPVGGASAQSLTGTGGTAPVFIYLSATGVLTFGVDGTVVTGASLGNLTLETGVTAFPSDAWPVAVCSASANTITTCDNWQAPGRDLLTSGDGAVIVTFNPTTGKQELSAGASILLADMNNDMHGDNAVNVGYVSVSCPNQAGAGTVVFRLAVLGSAPSACSVAPAGTSTGIVGVVVSGAGSTGVARVAQSGRATCEFDDATTAGHYVQASSTVAGKCHDAGQWRPTAGQILGRVLSTNGGPGAYEILLTTDIAGAAPPPTTTQITQHLPVGSCSAAALLGVSPQWNIPSGSAASASCYQGWPGQTQSAAAFELGSAGSPTLQLQTSLDPNWNGSPVTLKALLGANGANGSTDAALLKLEWACAAQTAADYWSRSYNAPVDSNTIVLASSPLSANVATWTVPLAGCAAGQTAWIRLARDNAVAGNFSGSVFLTDAWLSFGRTF